MQRWTVRICDLDLLETTPRSFLAWKQLVLMRKIELLDSGLRSFTSSVYISAFFIRKRKQRRRSWRNYTQSEHRTAAQGSQYTVDYANGHSWISILRALRSYFRPFPKCTICGEWVVYAETVRYFKKFVRRHNALFSKYGVSVRTHVHEGICIPLVVKHELSKLITTSRGLSKGLIRSRLMGGGWGRTCPLCPAPPSPRSASGNGRYT